MEANTFYESYALLFESQRTRIYSEEYSIKKGVRQSEALSSKLFKLAEKVIRAIRINPEDIISNRLRLTRTCSYN